MSHLNVSSAFLQRGIGLLLLGALKVCVTFIFPHLHISPSPSYFPALGGALTTSAGAQEQLR